MRGKWYLICIINRFIFGVNGVCTRVVYLFISSLNLCKYFFVFHTMCTTDLLHHHISTLSTYFWSTFRSVQVQVSTDYKTCGIHRRYSYNISYHGGAYSDTKRRLSFYNRKWSLHSFIHKMYVFKLATLLPQYPRATPWPLLSVKYLFLEQIKL
jgi:hypothetical protein